MSFQCSLMCVQMVHTTQDAGVATVIDSRELEIWPCPQGAHSLVRKTVNNCCCCCSTPWTATLQAPLSSTISWSLLKFMSTESVRLSNHLILCRPLLLLPLVFPSIKVFSNESALRIRWPKYWSLSFSKKTVTNALQITVIYKGIKQGLAMKNNQDRELYFRRMVQEILWWRHWKGLWEQGRAASIMYAGGVGEGFAREFPQS